MVSSNEELRVVAFGGGTGLPVLLRGLRDRIGNLTAVVTVADDGGSSGRLRQELGVAPPGDVRNCLVALAGRRKLAEVFNYRFEGGGDLSDHSVGNIIIAALSDISGGFGEGVEQAARFLRTKGSVYPEVTGEPAGVEAPRGVISAIRAADVVVLSPGSLFTSTIPALLGVGTREALAGFAGPVVYAANAMTQPGETTGFTLSDHLRALIQHVGPIVTDVLVHSGDLPWELVARYAAEEATPVEVDREEVERLGVRLRAADLFSDGASTSIRHDANRLAKEVCEIALVRL